MECRILLVTPEMASEWLRNNPRNRPLNLRVVDDYARTMTRREWVLNGEAVKISSDGTLLDGQHRLSAIVKSGIAVKMLVLFEMDPETQDTMDGGRRRTVGNVLAIHGESNVNVVGAVARRVWHWDQGNKRFANFQNPSTAELLKVLSKYPSIRRSAEIGTRTNKSYRPAGASVTGFAHHLLLPIDDGDCAVFFAQLETGAELHQGHPILTLRSRLQRDRDTQKRVPFHTAVAMYVRAWNALREGRDLSAIIQAPEANIPTPV